MDTFFQHLDSRLVSTIDQAYYYCTADGVMPAAPLQGARAAADQAAAAMNLDRSSLWACIR